MDSRIRENPERTFDLVLQVACPLSENEDPTVLWKFPQDFGDQEVLLVVPKFCFPFDVERVSQNEVCQNFTFVLTDIDSKQRFGFCRLTSGCKVCICLLSYLPWFDIYYKLLNTFADYLIKHQEDDLNNVLDTLYEMPVPKPATTVSLSVHLHFVVPDSNGLLSIPESKNLAQYIMAVNEKNMLHLYASMLHERRIIITSSKLRTLTACVHGSAAMLYPMYWQHIYIPVLPPHLLDYCCAPMPYLIGVHLSLLERVKNKSLEDVVILNVDTNTLESPNDDLHNLPSDVVSSLKSKLKNQSTATGTGVARAFLHSQAALFGSYRDALRYKPGEPITFCEASFVAHRSSTMRSFLEMAVNLQLFKQFIDGRLAKLNTVKAFTDVFEEEITEGGFCGSNSRSYQHRVMHTVKKGVHKASPAVKSAYKSAKDHAKKGLQGVKERMRLKDTEEENGLYRPDSPTSTKSLSPRRLQKRIHQKQHVHSKFPDYAIDTDDDLDTASKVSEDSGDMPSYTEDSEDSYELESEEGGAGQMNLLEEILDSLSATNIDRGSRLSAAKSLDFFRSTDEIDFSTTNNSVGKTSLAQAGAVSTAGSGDQSCWNTGQDDSAVHGKHLPPSPRRQCSTRSLPTLSSKPCEKPAGVRNSFSEVPPQTLALKTDDDSDPPVHPGITSELKLSPEKPAPEGSSILRRKVLSKETFKHYQERSQQGGGNRQPSMLVSWEKGFEDYEDGMENEDEKKVQEKGLLEEMDTLFCFSMALTSAQVQTSAGLDKS
ncbi:DENN domain-containing protein 1B [Trichomycterus rosablanca]|uniref:DENN domain-containing protein 1B n=1 Tax=Trichomycterus rosablanca TaxID=2290929 RepID=UPI002F350230